MRSSPREWLRGHRGDERDPGRGDGGGLLIAAEQRDATEWGSKWPDAWDAASKRKVRKWLG